MPTARTGTDTIPKFQQVVASSVIQRNVLVDPAVTGEISMTSLLVSVTRIRPLVGVQRHVYHALVVHSSVRPAIHLAISMRVLADVTVDTKAQPTPVSSSVTMITSTATPVT